MTPRCSPLPVFDPEKDGNPFAWIVRAAPKVRAQRAQQLTAEAAVKRAIQRAANEPVKP